MSRYSKYGRAAKCGSPDSKYMGRQNELEEDVKRKIEEARSFEKDLKDLITNSPGRLEFKYNLAIQVFLELKKEFNL